MSLLSRRVLLVVLLAFGAIGVSAALQRPPL